MPPGELCDFYVWVSRNAGQPALTQIDDDAEGSVRELAAEASYGWSLAPRDWLRVADYYRGGGRFHLAELQKDRIREARPMSWGTPPALTSDCCGRQPCASARRWASTLTALRTQVLRGVFTR